MAGIPPGYPGHQDYYQNPAVAAGKLKP